MADKPKEDEFTLSADGVYDKVTHREYQVGADGRLEASVPFDVELDLESLERWEMAQTIWERHRTVEEI
jgi:hypothetical protein